jgi:hypothetical protein
MRSALFALLLAAAPAWALPTDITAQYQLAHKAFGVIGRVDESFQRRGNTYTLRSVTRSEGALKVLFDDQVILESSGQVNANGLQPMRFAQRRASSDKHTVGATFDWDRGIMLSTQGEKTKEIPLPPQTQDRISVMYQFMNLSAVGTGAVTFNMSNGRKVDQYTYRFVEQERVETPAGPFETLHYERVTTDPKESHADVWLAKDRYMIPVRVVFDDPKGLRLEQTLVALEVR